MAKISEFLPTLMRVEGGYCNVSGDKGGRTKWGITEKTFKSYYPQTSQSILSMTYEQMQRIYKIGYWDKCRADEINNQSVANLIVDFAVNSGVARASRYVQQIVGVVQDGFIGPVTIKALNAMNQQAFFIKLKEKRNNYYEQIVKTDPSQEKFLLGWKNRLAQYQFKF